MEFEALFEAVLPVVADLWQRISKIGSCFKTSTSIVLQQCQNQNQVKFQKKDSGVVFKFFLTYNAVYL